MVALSAAQPDGILAGPEAELLKSADCFARQVWTACLQLQVVSIEYSSIRLILFYQMSQLLF